MSLETLTKAVFDPHIGSLFEIDLDNSRIPLELTDVDALGEAPGRTYGKKKGQSGRSPFSLIFLGPREPAFIQQALPMRHPEMGEIGLIFLVAISEDEDGRYYQALFS